MIGSVVYPSNDLEKNAREGIDAAMRLSIALSSDGGAKGVECMEMIGAVAGKDGVASFFVSKGKKLDLLEKITLVVYEKLPEDFLWQRGCLLRCELSVQVPFYYPLTDPSGKFPFGLFLYLLGGFVLQLHILILGYQMRVHMNL